MVQSLNVFSLDPDRRCGAALAAVLQPADRAGFVAGVMARVDAQHQAGIFAVARWSRAAVAVAAVALVAGVTTGVLARRGSPMSASGEPDALAAVADSATAAVLGLTGDRSADPRDMYTALVDQ